MRYEELNGPLAGWTYDEDGTIYTNSGYRCTAQQIEGALWIAGCHALGGTRYLITSDEAAGALRPLYERSDIDAGTKPTRLWLGNQSDKRVMRDGVRWMSQDRRRTPSSMRRRSGQR